MKRSLFICVAATLSLHLLHASVLTVFPSGRAELSASSDQGKEIIIQPMANWHNMSSHGNLPADDNAPFPVKIWCNHNQQLVGSFTAKQDENRGTLDYQLTADNNFKVGTAFVNVWLPTDEFAGTKYWFGANARQLPSDMKEWFVTQEWTQKLVFASKDGRRKIIFTFPKKTHFHIQDERLGGKAVFSVRIGAPWGRAFKKGDNFSVTLTIEEEGHPVSVAIQRPVTIAEGREWLAFTPKSDVEPGSAIDFSQMPWRHAPAGKFGYVVAKGENFEFEGLPNKPVRFYGANLCYGANYVDQETAEKTAKRLAATGYNAVRIHHHDQHGWGYFGLVRNMKDGTTLNPKELEKFDYLIAALVKNGLYMTTDLFVSRETVPWREVGIDKDGVMPMDEFKIWCVVHEGTWENLKKFTRALYTHINPHTGRSLAQEPALSFISIINEGNYNNYPDRVRNSSAWQEGWKKWLAEKKAKDPSYQNIKDTIPPRFNADTPDAIAFRIYMKEVDAAFVRKARAFLRNELGCKALITNSNGWSKSFVEHQEARETIYDYVDEHFYVDHPSNINGYPSSISNANLFKETSRGVPGCAFSRVLDKPFTITEFNYTAPGRNRSAGGLLIGSLAAFQNWNALWRFAWSHDGGSMKSDTAPALKHFNAVTDPINQIAERAVASLFLRGDMPSAKQTYEIVIPKDKLDALASRPVYSPAWSEVCWHAKLGTSLQPNSSNQFSSSFIDAYKKDSSPDEKVRSIPLGDGHVSIDSKNGTFAVTTPKTSGVYSEGNVLINASPITAKTSTRAALWLTALDQQSTQTSSRLLLVHLTDVQNAGTVYQDPDTRKIMLSGGKLPHLAMRGKAKVRLALTNADKIDVWALDFSGKRIAKIPSTISSDGELELTLRTEEVKGQVTFAYELVRQ